MGINAWLIHDPQIKLLSRRYKVSEYLLQALNVRDPRVIEEVARAARLAIDREFYKLYEAASDTLSFFGRPEGIDVSINEKDNLVRLMVKFKTTVVTVVLTRDEYLKRTPEEWAELLKGWIYVKAHKEVEKRQMKTRGRSIVSKRITWVADKVKFIQVNEDRQPFLRLVGIYARRFEFPVLAASLAVLGYRPDIMAHSETLLLLLARLLPLASAEPVHVVEFSRPGTGKTTLALYYEVGASWRYYAEPPSLATLVGDARTGAAIIARVNGLWFDEFDAWRVGGDKRQQMREIIEVMLTGMWQGRWQRSKGGSLSIVVDNPIPVVFTGNTERAENPREKLRGIIAAAAPDKAAAFDDRVMVAITAIREDIPEVIQSHLLRNVSPRPSVVKGMVATMEEATIVAPEPPSNPFKARRGEAYRRVYKTLTVLMATDVAVEGGRLVIRGYDQAIVSDMAKKFVKGVVMR